jgi:2-polyprenyl-6-hydroxyphenyl methylase/3-demethylubiquinone-9 3-methyltransferase
MDQRTVAGASIDTVEVERFDVPLRCVVVDVGRGRLAAQVQSGARRLHPRCGVPASGGAILRVPIASRTCAFSISAAAAGLLCEPLAALGGTVVGADPAPGAIEAARLHARGGGLAIDYRGTTAEALAAAGERFDIVLAMEVIEHVADHEVFIERCAELVGPGGLMILSTINRTWKSFAYAIVVAEYVLRLLPRGTHQWERFLKPEEIAGALARHGLRGADVSGVTMNC